MSKKEIAKTSKSAVLQLAERLSLSETALQSTLKNTAFRDCKTNEEFVAAVVVANTYGLNPLLKEIYAFPSNKGVVPIVPIDGWISLVNRRPEFDGCELKENEDDDGECVSVTATFYMKHRSHPVVITEYMDECKKKGGNVWDKWPRRMLRHKAYIQCARIAFGFSGIYDEDEGRRIVEAQEEETPTGKAGVAMPEAQDAETVTDHQPEETGNWFKDMLANFAKAKKLLGDKLYYIILNDHDLDHANGIKNKAQSEELLELMRKAYEAKKKTK